MLPQRPALDKENVNPSALVGEMHKDIRNLINKDLFKRRVVRGDSMQGIQTLNKPSTAPDERPRPVVPCNPQLVPEFRRSIQEFLQKKECFYQVNPLYMNNQEDISERMRAILVDWLVDVNLKFKLLPITLFLAVNLIDRFLSKESISRNQVQLVGVASLMIVAKFEEIYPPLLKDYVGVCDSAYTREQILEMESRILLTLNFNLTQTTSFAFLHAMQLDLQFDAKALAFGQYVIETALFDMSLLKYSNHLLAAGAVFLVAKVFRKDDWKLDFEVRVGVSEKLSKICAKDLYRAMQVQDKSPLMALKRKFATPQYFEMSKYRIEKISTSS
jgi:cyclin B